MSEVAVNKTKKRFIAGAVCPACSQPDKILFHPINFPCATVAMGSWWSTWAKSGLEA